MERYVLLMLLSLLQPGFVLAQSLFVETETFTDYGGWSLDHQFMDQMASPYLIAHGIGRPVKDAKAKVNFKDGGSYYVYVRTYNWTSPWSAKDGPGAFTLLVNDHRLPVKLGTKGASWMWQYAGKVNVPKGESEIALHDLTGFDGRCDALYFTKHYEDVPPSDIKELGAFRYRKMQIPIIPEFKGEYDFVVVGGGIAGISAAISAARLGCKVALLDDRKILGGNSCSDIRVQTSGMIEIGKYKNLGGLQKEFGMSKANSEAANKVMLGKYFGDEKKLQAVKHEKNITLYQSMHLINAEKDGECISTIVAKDVTTGRLYSFSAPLYADCTGDGTLGYLAGADYRVGRESRIDYGEILAPVKADSMVMGTSIQWYAVKREKKTSFPMFEYGLTFNDTTCMPVTKSNWTWETGMNKDQIKDFEYIRDYDMLVVYSNWSYLKNKLKNNREFTNMEIAWLGYMGGKRESRRLMGDYILKADDVIKNVFHEDASFGVSWSLDVHFPEPRNSKLYPGKEFIATNDPIWIYPYNVPYRCLYSRNVNNLFMAGRDISVTHVALGCVRVQRTGGQMGEVVGMAASICKRHGVKPRAVYRQYLNELKELMSKGVGGKGMPNNQNFNEGWIQKGAPVTKYPE